MADSSDPLQSMFGMSARELFAQPALYVSEGPIERFPEFMRGGPLQSRTVRHWTDHDRHGRGPVRGDGGRGTTGVGGAIGSGGQMGAGATNIGGFVGTQAIGAGAGPVGGWDGGIGVGGWSEGGGEPTVAGGAPGIPEAGAPNGGGVGD